MIDLGRKYKSHPTNKPSFASRSVFVYTISVVKIINIFRGRMLNEQCCRGYGFN